MDPAPLFAPTKLDVFFSGKGRRGILNTSNTCYVGSVVQLLAHCPVFLRFILGGSSSRMQQQPGSVACSLRDLLINLWISPGDSTTMKCGILDGLIQALSSSPCCTLNLHHQNDAQELLVQLLEAVQRDVGGAVELPTLLATADALDASKVSLPVFMDRAWFDAHHKHYSPLAAMLHGQLAYSIECSACGVQHPSSDIFSTLTVDMLPSPSTSSDSVSLGACITRIFKSEELSCGWKCSACKVCPPTCTRRCRLWRAPHVLLCCIKRFDAGTYRGKSTTSVEIPEYINVTKVIAEQQRASYLQGSTTNSGDGDNNKKQTDEGKTTELPQVIYRLMAVLCHYGSAHSGHYMTFARDSARDEWLMFDDETVTDVPFERIDEQSAYIIAYEMISL
jgi:ubiquitin C-terminal hydrolase